MSDSGQSGERPAEKSALNTLFKIACGPAVFLAAWLLAPPALSHNAQLTLATFLWAVAWWIAQPIPWAVTSLLPLVLFPAFAVMSTGQTVALYGQNIFFWILGTVMLGYAMEKHGLARRLALWFLGLRGAADTTYRLTFMYMLATAVVSMFVSDAAAVAMMLPIGMSIVAYLRQIRPDALAEKRSALGAFLALGTLCAAEAGGMATIAGLPHNALSVSIGARFTSQTIGWFQWMVAGVPIFVASLLIYYVVLRFFFPPEFTSVPGGREFITSEKAELGRLSVGERNVLIVFACMAILFMLPSLVTLTLGPAHPAAAYLRQALPIWVVPPVVLFLLFLLPADLRKGEGTLVWRDVVEHGPWNVMMLCMGAMAMTDALAEFGFLEFTKSSVENLGVGPLVLPYVTAWLVGFSTNILSGLAATSLFCGIFIPMAINVGFNPASMTMLIPNNAVGVMFPWAGAAAGTAFATGYLDLKQMIKVGVVTTVLNTTAVATLHIVFSPVL